MKLELELILQRKFPRQKNDDAEEDAMFEAANFTLAEHAAVEDSVVDAADDDAIVDAADDDAVDAADDYAVHAADDGMVYAADDDAIVDAADDYAVDAADDTIIYAADDDAIIDAADDEAVVDDAAKDLIGAAASSQTGSSNDITAGLASVAISAENKSRVCWNCEVDQDEEIKLKKCAGCKRARYCSKECQEKDWSEHKLLCDQLEKERREEKRRRKAEKIQQELQ